jgi:mercuric reductase
METSRDNIWAAGDVTGEPMLETVAAKEGAYAVENAFMRGQRKKTVSYDEVPSAVFTYPEVARVGLTEAQAHQRGIRCNCTTLPFDLVPKAHIIDDTTGLVKMVIESKTKRVLGVHIVAPHAADLIHEGVLAVKLHLTIDDIIDTVHVFPTLSESTKLAAQSFYKDVGSLSCCTE